MAKERRRVIFKGNVQGVGFRFTACRAAGGPDVTGFVRNLPDGTVEVVAEGESAEIDAFLDDLADRMGHHIRDRNEQRGQVTGQFRSFDVRY